MKAVYRLLQEAEFRTTAFVPYWDLPGAHMLPSQREYRRDQDLLNATLDELIEQAFATQQERELEDLENQDYDAEEDVSAYFCMKISILKITFLQIT